MFVIAYYVIGGRHQEVLYAMLRRTNALGKSNVAICEMASISLGKK